MNYVVDFEKRRRITNATKSKICSYQTVAYTKSHSQMSLCFNSLISVNVLYMVKLVHVLNIHDIIFVAGHYETTVNQSFTCSSATTDKGNDIRYCI